MILTDFLPAKPDRSWALARQLGVTHAICMCAPELIYLPRPDHLHTLCTIRDHFTAEGFTLYGLEGDQFDCQANFLAVGEDIAATARRFADRIVFVHFRDIAGTREDFNETFHDNGPTDMPAMLRPYHEIGFRGPAPVDHPKWENKNSFSELGYSV